MSLPSDQDQAEHSLLIPLSALNQYAYCPRRCFLIHGEGEFTDNVHTVSGSREHERVDNAGYEHKADVRVAYAVPVWSDCLGLTGKCDVLEFRGDGTIYPVEYKHGPKRRWLNDDLQLAAQAMCVEEMTGKPAPKGAIFHQKSRRRREVIIDDSLRSLVKETASAIRAMLAAGVSPPPIEDSRRCGECSLKTICEPELLRAVTHVSELAAGLFQPEEDAV